MGLASPTSNPPCRSEGSMRFHKTTSVRCLRLYREEGNGVYNAGDCGTSMNHAVTLVGYGTSPEGIKYWLAKNSWGTTRGENGYIRLRRYVEWPRGMCGVAQYASYLVA
ncbi:hypothetical protein YC2023_083279 [Brassica napus]